jgi:hypothetical protein
MYAGEPVEQRATEEPWRGGEMGSDIVHISAAHAMFRFTWHTWKSPFRSND